MTRHATIARVAPAAPVSALGPASVSATAAPRPTGRYHLQAPEASVGSVLRVTTAQRSTRFVEVVNPHGRRLFVDLDGNEVAFASWEFATLAEVRAFKLERRVGELADGVDLHGALSLRRVIDGMDRLERDATIRAVADELRARNKHAKASQVLILRFEEDR